MRIKAIRLADQHRLPLKIMFEHVNTPSFDQPFATCAFSLEQLRNKFTSQGTAIVLQELCKVVPYTSAGWLCYKAVAIKRSPRLRPSHQASIISTLPLKTPPKETFNSFSCWLDARVGGTHESLSQILKAVSRMRSSFDSKIEIFQFRMIIRNCVICSAQRVLLTSE